MDSLKYFGQPYKLFEVLADKIEHFLNLDKDSKNYENQPEGELKSTPDEAFLFEKIAFEI